MMDPPPTSVQADGSKGHKQSEGGELGSDEDGRWNSSTLMEIAERSTRDKDISSLQQELNKCAKQAKNEGKYACDTVGCGYRSKKLWNLKAHCVRKSHNSSHLTTTTEVHSCPECGKIFSRKSNLKAHRESKKFPCQQEIKQAQINLLQVKGVEYEDKTCKVRQTLKRQALKRQALRQKINVASNLSWHGIKQESSSIGFDDSPSPDFKWSDAKHILKDLSLSYVALGDYVVIMNDREDVTFSGEPYIALQLWFNTKTGKVICRDVLYKNRSSRKTDSQ